MRAVGHPAFCMLGTALAGWPLSYGHSPISLCTEAELEVLVDSQPRPLRKHGLSVYQSLPDAGLDYHQLQMPSVHRTIRVFPLCGLSNSGRAAGRSEEVMYSKPTLASPSLG